MTGGTGLQTVLEGEYDLILFVLWIEPVGERRFSAGDPVSGSRRGTPDFIKSQKIRAGLSSGGGPAS